MKKSPMFISATNTINYPKKQFMFDVDYVKAAKFGLYKEQISEFLSTLYGGYALDNYFNISGLNVPVFVQLGVYDLKDPASLEKLQIKSPITNNYYPMSEFVSFKLVAKPSVISTYNDFPMVSINANLAKNVSLSGAMDFVNTLLKTEAPSFQYQYFGDAETYLEGNYQTVLVMVLGMFCIYFLLAVLFRSLLDPFIILLTVPFSIVGGALSLYLVGGTLNLFSVLGLITLIGLITKHGVLIVQFANEELRAKACTVKEAILMATQQRFRPIIMTTLAMTLGVLPLVLSYDVMYISRQNLGIVIVGGLLVGTFFSLFIVPLVYMLVKKVDAT